MDSFLYDIDMEATTNDVAESKEKRSFLLPNIFFANSFHYYNSYIRNLVKKRFFFQTVSFDTFQKYALNILTNVVSTTGRCVQIGI